MGRRGIGRRREEGYFEEVSVAGFVEVDVGVGGVLGLDFISRDWGRKGEEGLAIVGSMQMLEEEESVL